MKAGSAYHLIATVIMSSKKVKIKKMFGPGPTGPYGSYAYDGGYASIS